MTDDQPWYRFEAAELSSTVVGRELRFFPSIGSTNDELKQAARAGAAEGLVFLTDEQTAGRGRRGRSWAAPSGSSLLVSVLLRPTWLPADDAFLLTMLCAVAAAEALSTPEKPVQLKWPNDLQIEGRKLGGILVETELSADRLHWTVLGCGINVNWNPAEIPELAGHATSLAAELGHELDRRELLRALLSRIDAWYSTLRRGARSALIDAWRERLSTLGQAVRAETPQGMIEGQAIDVTATGALVIEDADGHRHVVTAGDVSIRPLGQ